MSRYGHFKKYVCHYCDDFTVHDHERKTPAAASVGSSAYGAKVNKAEPGKVYLLTPGVEHGMEWWEAQNVAARLMDAAAEAVKLKGR